VQSNKKDITWEYRASHGWQPGVIYEVGMRWPLIPVHNLSQQVRASALKRTQTQPLQAASCGSVFKNPIADQKKAGALIEQCGLKGHQVGQACVSEKHANFIVNQGGATSEDIHQLIQHVQQKVHHQFGITLETEVKYLGRWTPTQSQ